MRFIVTEAQAGTRLDKLVVDQVPGLGRAGAKRLFAEGKVLLTRPFPQEPAAGADARAGTDADADAGAGTGTDADAGTDAGARADADPGADARLARTPRARRASKGDVAAAGDVVEVQVADDASEGPVADAEAPLAVVLETADVVVVDKPSGQPTAPLEPGERGTVVNALLARYPEMRAFGVSPREAGIVHRLDTDTSGLVLAGRTEAAFAALRAGLAEGKLDKRYLLVCAAADLPEGGSIEIPLAPHPKDRRRVYPCTHPRDVVRYAPRPAVTAWTLVATDGPWALVEARVAKASRHQIRAHFAAIEHPLAGDVLYGGEQVEGLARHALHAHYLAWHGDARLGAFVARSMLPADMAALVPTAAEKLRLGS